MKHTKINKGLLLLLVYWMACNYLVLHTPFTVFNAPVEGVINNALYTVSDALSPDELNDHNWHPTQLPDDWYSNQHLFSQQNFQQIWYRAKLILGDHNKDIWAVYLPSVTHNAAVYINGVWIGQGGQFSEPVSRHHNQPLLFSFSSELLQQGENKIELKVKTSFHEQGLLDQFYIAPVKQLQGAYLWKHFVRIDLVQWFTMAMYLISFIVLVFWLARPKDSIYGLFSLELFIWATHNLNLFVAEIPVSALLWEAMNLATLGWIVTVMIFFNHRYAGGGNKKIERFLMAFSVLGTGLFFMPDIGSVLHIGYRIWDVFIMVFGIYAIYHLIKVYRDNKNPDVYLMLVVGIPILVFGFHDILMINHYIDRRDGLTMQYSVIPSVILFSWFMVRRFVQSINKAENLAETLELRVQEKQYELHSQYEKLKTMQKESVLSEERERIMRDLHDGIGGQLVSVVTILQEHNGEVFSSVREKVQHSLTDLRFVIDSLDPVLNDLPTLLGMMRMRLIDQLEAANIELEWAVTELPEMQNMSPHRSLHIMRIVQEAITNSIKHADSKTMTLATGVINEDQIFIDVIDYGIGLNNTVIEMDEQQLGRGLKNMLYRAEKMGAKLQIDSDKKGTRVRLLLNIHSD